MSETLKVFEDACRNFHDAKAKEFLSEFPKHRDVLWVCQQILELECGDASTIYHFQAAVALRKTLTIQWSTYNDHQRHSLQNFILQTILKMTHVSALQSPAVKVLCGTAAIALKLQYLSTTHATEFMEGIIELVRGPRAVMRLAGLMTLQAIVEEMDITTATPLGLSVDYHRKCNRAFKDVYLLKCFYWCLELVVCAVLPMTVIDMEGAAVCFASLAVMNASLSWDFDESNRPRLTNNANQDLRSGTVSTSIKLDNSWSQLLGDEKLCNWIAMLALKLNGEARAFDMSADCLYELHSFLLNLCCINSSSFGTDPSSGDLKRRFIERLLSQLLQFIPTENEIYNQIESLAVFCRCMDALSRSHSCRNILSAADEIGNDVPFLRLLCGIQKSLLEHGCLSVQKADSVEQECCMNMLQVWERFCTPTVYEIYKSVSNLVIRPGVAACAEEIFEAVVSSEMKLSAENAASEDADLLDQELMETYAVICRTSSNKSFPSLARYLLQHKHNICEEVWPDDGLDVVRLEQLCFFVQLSGNSLADDLYGEEPAVPLQLKEISSNSQSPENDPVVQLSKALLNMGSLLLNQSALCRLSERVMEKIIEALIPWSETYLIPEETAALNLSLMFGNNDNGQRVVHELCSIANVCLVKFPTNIELQHRVCSRLLKILTRSAEIRKHVVTSASWNELLNAFSKFDAVFLRMHQKMWRHIAYALSIASEAYRDNNDQIQYLRQLLDPCTNEVRRLSEKGGTSADGSYLLEILRGVTQSTRAIPRARNILYAFVDNLFQPLLRLQSIFAFDENFTCALLKLAAEIVDVHIFLADVPPPRVPSLIEAKRLVQDTESEGLLRWAMELIRCFTGHRRGVTFISASQMLSKEIENEQCRDIRAALSLLKNITDRELAVHETETLDVATIVLQGMDLVIPLITSEMLKFPKLCFQYFDLLSHLCEIYPQKISEFPLRSLQTLMSTLDYGLTLVETRRFRIVLESLESLARHQHLSLDMGQRGLKDDVVPDGESFASYFIRAVLKRLLESDEGGDAIAAASGTLYHFFICEREKIEQILHSIVVAFGDYPSMVSDIQQLLFSDVDTNQSNREAQNGFRERLYVFVKSVRQKTRKH